MLRKMMTPLALISVLATGVACTKDEEVMEEPIAVEDKSKHAFTVDKEGKVDFKAEIVYFKFDDHTLTKLGQERLNALADFMKRNDKTNLQIEGHCDQRGTPEYNLALGQMRARSVLDYLKNLGIDEKRLATVSYGEEKLAAQGEDEESWQKNRRAQFVMTNL